MKRYGAPAFSPALWIAGLQAGCAGFNRHWTQEALGSVLEVGGTNYE
jgi:hypothetical protein